MAILEIKNLTKTFGGLTALRNLTFQVQEGEIMGLIGPNGSGKTTTFNCITNCYPLTSGDILFRGKSIVGLKTHRICWLGIGRTFQIVRPLSRMTVLDNVIASAFCRISRIKEATVEAHRTLEFCGLADQQDKPAKELTIGGRKRLEIARALATKPVFLLLDETAGGLTPVEIEDAITLIRKIRANGTTILMIEHNMKVIMTACDRIHVINFGQSIAEGTPHEVANDPAVIEAYLWKAYADS